MMKLTIWQQYSSNHSANFTSVGQFTSPQQAQIIGEQIRNIVRAMLWVKKHINNNDAFDVQLKQLQEARNDIPPPLIQADFLHFAENFDEDAVTVYNEFLKTNYKLDKWHNRLDWIEEKSPERDIMIHDHLIIVDPARNTWAGLQIFDVILEDLGGVVVSWAEGNNEAKGWVINLTCKAPSVDVAEQIRQEIHITSDDYKQQYLVLPHVGEIYMSDDTELIIDETTIHLNYCETIILNEREKTHDFYLIDEIQQLVGYFQKHNCTDINYTLTQPVQSEH